MRNVKRSHHKRSRSPSPVDAHAAQQARAARLAYVQQIPRTPPVTDLHMQQIPRTPPATYAAVSQNTTEYAYFLMRMRQKFTCRPPFPGNAFCNGCDIAVPAHFMEQYDRKRYLSPLLYCPRCMTQWREALVRNGHW